MRKYITCSSKDKLISKTPLAIYGFFLLALIIDIGGAFGIKYSAFFFMLVYVMVNAAKNTIKIPASFVLELLLFFIAPLVFLILAITVFSVDAMAAIGAITPFVTWLLYPIFLKISPKERVISLFIDFMFLGSIIIIFMFSVIYLAHFLGNSHVIIEIDLFANEFDLGYFGAKPFEGTTLFFPNVYPRWTLLLIPAEILLLKGDLIKFISIFLATLLTASTGAILFLLVGLILATFSSLINGKINRSYLRRFLIICMIITFGIITIKFLNLEYILDFIITKLGNSPSTSIKIGHINSIRTILFEDTTRLLFGMGVGSSFWSSGVNQFVTNVEVSHFNLLRQFGLLYSLAFFSYVFLLFIKLYWLRNEYGLLLSISLLVLFFAAGTNPLLISPVFFLIMIIARAFITQTSREREKRQTINS